MQRRLWVIVATAGLVLVGCAGAFMSINDLKNAGYEKVDIIGTTMIGEKRAPSNYEVWWKESREGGRTVHVCMVPRVPNAGYQWAAALFVAGKEVWRYEAGLSYDSPARPGRSGLRTGIDCAESPALPEGKLGLGTRFVWWQ